MIAEKKFENLEHSAVKLTVTLQPGEGQKRYDDLIAQYTKSAQIKGFRKGKVPAKVLIQKFGESLLAEAAVNLIEESLPKALEDAEKQPLPFVTPELQDAPELELGKSFTFSVTYDTMPDFVLEEYKSVEIAAPSCKVTKEDLDRELEEIRRRNAMVVEKKDGKIEKEDVVNMDYEEVDDQDQGITGTKRENYVFPVGSEYHLYKIDDDILSMAEGDEKIIEKEYEQDFNDPSLAGRKVRLKVKINNIKENQLPELDDELAQDVSEKYNTLEELKKDIDKNLKEQAENRIESIKIEKYLDALLEKTEIDLPVSLVQVELDGMWEDFLRRTQLDENRVKHVLQNNNKSKETLIDGWKPEAEKSIKKQLLLEKLINAEKVEISEEEYAKAIEEQAAKADMEPAEMQEYLESNDPSGSFRRTLLNKKLFEGVFREITIKQDKKLKFLDLMGKKD